MEFVGQQARGNEQLCLLPVNTLQQYCTSADPELRALALDTLVALTSVVCAISLSPMLARTPETIDYVTPLVLHSLQDRSPRVRQTAALSVSRMCRDFASHMDRACL
jgi:vesicle coat complex subunit